MRGKVLVVEDNAVALGTLQHLLKLEGFETDHAGNGLAALTVLLAHPTPPDAIVLDIKMPGMCGVELLQRLRADGRWKAIPVVVTTADPNKGWPALKGDPLTRVLIKPFEVSELVRLLRGFTGTEVTS